MDKVSIKKEFIVDYIRAAKRRLDNAKEAFDENDYAYTIRVCQEIVELCFKALLRKYGFIVPKSHDLRKDIKENLDLFSKEFADNFKVLNILSRDLRNFREEAMYGDEDNNIAPSKLFDKKNVLKYLNDTQLCFELSINELKEFLK